MMSNRSYRGFNLGPIEWLIVTNLMLFVMAYVASFFNRDFGRIFGFHPAIFLEQPWTIITNMFIHDGIWHIFANMFTLYFFGSYLVRLVGERNFLLIYFIGGILGNIFYAFISTPPLPAVGASGAVFALAGALTVLRPRERVFVFPIPAPIPLWGAVLGGFLILSILPGIAWQAHLGGLVFGLVAGYLLKRRARWVF